MIDTYTRNIKEIESDLRDKPKDGSNDDNQKYEILYKKEKEINDFTEKYEAEKQQLHSKMTNT
jgi:argonaute-like protein implicated in RNA metabolism and viral defense